MSGKTVSQNLEMSPTRKQVLLGGEVEGTVRVSPMKASHGSERGYGKVKRPPHPRPGYSFHRVTKVLEGS